MSASDLNDVFPLLGLSRDRVAQGFYYRYESLFHIHCRRYIHRRGKRIVGRLRHIDVVVGVNWRLTPEPRARKLAASVGDHLIHVHVELCAAAGHPDMQGKHVWMLASEDFIADLTD